MKIQTLFLIALGFATAPAFVCAQEVTRPTEFAISAGIAQIDGSGVHTTPIASVSVARELASPFMVFQLGVSVIRPKEDYSGNNTSELMPEAQFQLQSPRGAVRPYLGAGIGIVYVSNSDAAAVARMLSIGAGIRATITPHYGARFELSARALGSNFGGSITEATVGLTRKF